MASSSSSSAQQFVISALGFLPVSEKLTRGNFPLWKAQVITGIRGAEAFEFLSPGAAPPAKYLAKKAGDDDKEPPILNKEYTTWVAKDQQVLSYLFVSCGQEILQQISSATTVAQAWAKIEEFFSSQSRARVISTRMALATASKGNSTVAEYYTKMKGLVDEMASTGRRLEDDEMVSYILTGLGDDYDSVMTSVANRVEPISLGELYTQLVAHE